MASMAAYPIIRAKVNSGHLRILNISLYMNLLDRFPFQTVQSGAGAGEDGTWMVQFCLSPPILSFFGSVFPKLQQESPGWVSESGEHLRPPPLNHLGEGGLSSLISIWRGPPLGVSQKVLFPHIQRGDAQKRTSTHKRVLACPLQYTYVTAKRRTISSAHQPTSKAEAMGYQNPSGCYRVSLL